MPDVAEELDDLQDEQPNVQNVAPQRLTDDELRSHQDALRKLHNDMKSTNDEVGECTDPARAQELEAQWDRMETEYDEHLAAINAHRKHAERSEHRKQRLRDQADATQRMPRAVRDRLRGGGSLDPEDYDVDEEHDRLMKANHLVNGAVRAFVKAKIGRTSSITEDEYRAANGLGFHPSDDDLRLPLMNDARFQKMRDIFLGEMDGLQTGRGYKKACRTASREIRNALSTETGGGDASSENYLFGTTFMMTLEEAMLFYGGLLPNVEVIRTANGNPIYFGTTNDTTNAGRMITEATAVPAAGGATANQADPTFGRMVLQAYIGTSDAVTLSNSLLEDNQVGMEQRLPQMLGTRLARLKNAKGTVGAGTTEPDGIVPQSALGTTAAANNAIVLDEIFDLTHTVDLAIRQSLMCKYMFHDLTLKLFRKLKDSEGRYLWQLDARSGAPDSLDGYDYVINNDMPQVGATNKSVLFGNLGAYKFREVVSPESDGGVRVRVLRELYALSDQTAFVAFCRFDGRLLNAGDNPVVHLIHPA